MMTLVSPRGELWHGHVSKVLSSSEDWKFPIPRGWRCKKTKMSSGAFAKTMNLSIWRVFSPLNCDAARQPFSVYHRTFTCSMKCTAASATAATAPQPRAVCME